MRRGCRTASSNFLQPFRGPRVRAMGLLFFRAIDISPSPALFLPLFSRVQHSRIIHALYTHLPFFSHIITFNIHCNFYFHHCMNNLISTMLTKSLLLIGACHIASAVAAKLEFTFTGKTITVGESKTLTWSGGDSDVRAPLKAFN